MDSTSPHSPLKPPIMISHATWNKIQTPNLGQHDPASANPFYPLLFCPPIDTPTVLALLPPSNMLSWFLPQTFTLSPST